NKDNVNEILRAMLERRSMPKLKHRDVDGETGKEDRYLENGSDDDDDEEYGDDGYEDDSAEEEVDSTDALDDGEKDPYDAEEEDENDQRTLDNF
ncbi:MAG: hypothetical protein ACOC32_03420, partial [Nanoarchaeota archaeon]